jgi:single-strand DNA-binding protein
LDSGVAVVTLPIATTERVKDRNGEWREITEWHNVVFWRGLAEAIEKNVRKGHQIFVEGKLRNRSWEDSSGQKRYATEIVADTLRLFSRKDNNNSQQNGQPFKPVISSVINDVAGSDEVDDLPF